MKQILVIDDERQVRAMLRLALERTGYAVVEASDGKEGIRLYREKLCDLIITDLIMPEKEGIEIIRELKQEFPDIKIIAMSGGGLVSPDNYLYIAGKLGARRTFAKPVDRGELLNAVEELLN